MGHEVITFGCRLNAFESESMRKQLLSHAGPAQRLIVINTCAVTGQAEKQAKQAIRKARRNHPDAKIIVTGCAAQIRPDHYSAMKEVDVVLGNQEKMQAGIFGSLDTPSASTVKVQDIMQVKETAGHLVSSFDGRTRAFMEIQNGCNHRCTFCIIPYGRGNSRSVPAGAIVQHIQTLVTNGYKEVVLTGVDITDYGKDLPGAPSLGSLVRRILHHVPELPRLRLSSVDVAEIDSGLLQLIKEEPRLMPHIHLSVQSGDDMILKRMKRRHTRQQVVDFCTDIRRARPEVAFGADIIAGFPTETDAMFENTLRLVEEAELQFLHVFPYSARHGTPAARMPQLPQAIRKQRATLLRNKGETILATKLHHKAKSTVRALVEKPLFARAEDFSSLILSSPHNVGDIVQVTVGHSDGKHLYMA